MSYLDDLKMIVTMNSYTKNKSGVDAVARQFDVWLEALGYETTVFLRELIGEHRLYRSSNVNGKKLLLVGHLDTVFPPNTFEQYRQDDNWVYGPGVCDMKGGNIVLLEALRRLKNSDGTIENIDVLLVSDEETGSDDSKYVSASLAEEYDYCLVYEAAGAEGDIVVGRKGVGTFSIEITGLASHAGNHYCDGIDANLEASRKLLELVKLTDLDNGTTLNVGIIEGGIGANTVSPHAHITFELRYNSIRERDRVLAAVHKIVATSYVSGSKATLSGGIQRDVMLPSRESLALVETMERISNQRLPIQERGGVSDANIFSAHGVVTLDGLGPFGDGDHTPDERASKVSFEERIALSHKVFQHFVIHKSF